MKTQLTTESPDLNGTGLEVLDLADYPEFSARKLHTRDVGIQMEGMRRLTHAFVEKPQTILQELVNAAVELCGAESAAISVEKSDRTEESYYEWVATAGNYAGFLNASLPQHPSACGVCLERDRPQLFRVTQQFFNAMGVEAPVVTDGLLLPWHTEETRGTIWIMAHERAEAFDGGDLRMMQMLADFAAMATRQQRQHQAVMKQASAAAAATMANELAHEINNPLQILSNYVYLGEVGRKDGKALAQEMAEPLLRLTQLVKKLLALPLDAAQTK